jgi:hypothetical protein
MFAVYCLIFVASWALGSFICKFLPGFRGATQLNTALGGSNWKFLPCILWLQSCALLLMVHVRSFGLDFVATELCVGLSCSNFNFLVRTCCYRVVRWSEWVYQCFYIIYNVFQVLPSSYFSFQGSMQWIGQKRSVFLLMYFDLKYDSLKYTEIKRMDVIVIQLFVDAWKFNTE